MQTAVQSGIRASLVFAIPSQPAPPSKWRPVAAAVVLHALLVVAYVLAFGNNVSALVCLQQPWVGEGPFKWVTVGISATGYDGQYCYALARNPWQKHTAYLDFAPYRHARILYPALAWLVTGGHPQGLLWALPALNLLAVLGLAWLGVVLATHYGRNPWWGFVLPMAVNVGISLLRDLTDPLAALAVCGLLTAWLLRWRPWTLAVWAVLAVLSREQNALVVGIVAVTALWQRDWLRGSVTTAACLLWVGWVVALRQIYGAWPFSPENVAMPLEALAYRWTHLAAGTHAGSAYLHAAGLSLLMVQVCLCLEMIFQKTTDHAVKLLGAAGVVLALVGGSAIYADYNSYLRVFAWLPLALWLWTVQSGRTWPVLVLLPMGLWPCLAVLRAWLG